MFSIQVYSKSNLTVKVCQNYYRKINLHSKTQNLKLISPLNISTAIQENYLKKKFDDFVKYYEEITGMDEVRLLQNRVIEAQDRFASAQEKRRNMSKEINEIQSRLKEIYSELDATARGEERYLHLITQEHAILKEERKLTSEFALVEREERDSFTTLSACVKVSHEKERAQAERTKYWSIIGSIIGTMLGIAGSSINNEFKMNKLRKMVQDLAVNNSIRPSEITAALLAHHEQELSSIVTEIKNAANSLASEKEQEKIGGRIDKLLHKISLTDQNYQTPQNFAQHLEKKVDNLLDILSSSQRYEGQVVAIPSHLETLIQKQSQDTKYVLVGLSIVGVAVPLLIAFLLR